MAFPRIVSLPRPLLLECESRVESVSAFLLISKTAADAGFEPKFFRQRRNGFFGILDTVD